MTPLLCKDCRHVERVPSSPDDWRCQHESSFLPGSVSLVTGEMPSPRVLRCVTARTGMYSGTCGIRGQFWEPVQ